MAVYGGGVRTPGDAVEAGDRRDAEMEAARGAGGSDASAARGEGVGAVG